MGTELHHFAAVMKLALVFVSVVENVTLKKKVHCNLLVLHTNMCCVQIIHTGMIISNNLYFTSEDNTDVAPFPE